MSSLRQSLVRFFKSTPSFSEVSPHVFQKAHQLASNIRIRGKDVRFMVLKPNKRGDDFGFEAKAHRRTWSIARWHKAQVSASYQREAAKQFTFHPDPVVAGAAFDMVFTDHLGLDQGKLTNDRYRECLRILATAEKQRNERASNPVTAKLAPLPLAVSVVALAPVEPEQADPAPQADQQPPARIESVQPSPRRHLVTGEHHQAFAYQGFKPSSQADLDAPSPQMTLSDLEALFDPQ